MAHEFDEQGYPVRDFPVTMVKGDEVVYEDTESGVVQREWNGWAVKGEPAAALATAKPFDPSSATASAVNEYLLTADEGERERVLTAERAGQNRKSVTGE